jgi:peroxiredoxin
VELQNRLADFEREGVAVYAISYDPLDVLRDFAERHDIAYPLLADEDSVVIKRLGLYNEHLEQQAAHYGLTPRENQFGVPYPGSFVLDEDGILQEKIFEQSYRIRPQPADLLEDVFGAEIGGAAVSDEAETPELRASAWLNTPTYRPYQRLRIQLGIQVREGLHIYGRPIPEGFFALSVDVAPLEGLEAGELELPEPHPYRVEGLDEQFQAYEGELRGSLPLALTQNIGDVTLDLTLSYQACTDSECFPPSEMRLSLPVRALDNVPG